MATTLAVLYMYVHQQPTLTFTIASYLIGPSRLPQVQDQVLEALASAEIKHAKVDATIVTNLGRALGALSKRQTEQQRCEAGILLRCVASPTVAQGNSKHGSNELIARRLGAFVGYGRPLPTGSRLVRGKRYNYAFTDAIQAREEFDAKVKEASLPKEDLAPGDAVLCRGTPAKLSWYEEATGRCGVTFSHEGVDGETVAYASRFLEKGKDNKQSARLQRLQPTLLPPPRMKRSDAVSEETRDRVREIYTLTCPTSPHTKDARKRYLGPHVVQARAMSS